MYQSMCSCISCHEVKSIKGIHSHYITSHTQKGMDRLILNGKKTAINSQISTYLKQLTKWKIYYASPNKCNECKISLNWFTRTNKFCSSSCSALYSNKLRPIGHSSRSKGNISRAKKLTKLNLQKLKILNLNSLEFHFVYPAKNAFLEKQKPVHNRV